MLYPSLDALIPGEIARLIKNVRDTWTRPDGEESAGDAIIAGANIPFDLACLINEFPELIHTVYRLFDQGRIYDVQVAQALDAIAGGHLGIDPRDGIFETSPDATASGCIV